MCDVLYKIIKANKNKTFFYVFLFIYFHVDLLYNLLSNTYL